MASHEDRLYEMRMDALAERDRSRGCGNCRCISPCSRYERDEYEDSSEEEQDYLFEVGQEDDLAEQMRFQVVCDGPELDEPVVIETWA